MTGMTQPVFAFCETASGRYVWAAGSPLIELLLGEIGDPSLAPIFDVTMMVMSSGRERSLAEYKRLFEAAGLRATNVIPTNTPMTILEAVAG